MIDIRSGAARKQDGYSTRSVLLLLALCFVSWDAGYFGILLERYIRKTSDGSVTHALIVTCDSMNADQQYTVSSPILDEIADRAQIKFRIVEEEPGSLANAADWIKSLHHSAVKQAPCMILRKDDASNLIVPIPASVAEFKDRLGIK